MAILVDKVIDVHTAEAIIDSLNDETLFQDGKKTAGRTARSVKHNLQADAQSKQVIGAAKLVEKALGSNPFVKHAALPAKFAKIMFSRYNEGMTYGAHIDDAIIADTRTDLSFTLFLSDPDTYEGGELILNKHDGDEAIKLPKGSMYLYPSNTVHYVAPVTSGMRLAAVGWIQSRVRLEEHRNMLFDLHMALQQLPESPENSAARLNILKVQNNLLRLWAD